MRLAELLDDALARTPVELVSPLSRDEVLRRLTEAIDSEWVFGGSKPVVGRVAADGLRLRLRIGYRNSFQTFLFGEVKDDGRGSRINARAGMHPFAAAFMALWITAVAVLALAAVSAMLGSGEDFSAQGLVWLAPLAMVAFGFGLVAMGRWLARNERAKLVAFLETTAQAKVAAR